MLSLSRHSCRNLTRLWQSPSRVTPPASISSACGADVAKGHPLTSTNFTERLITNRFLSTSTVCFSDSPSSSSESPVQRRRLPPLMEFNEIVWPSLLKTIKNWILVHFIIRPYFDKSFDLREFVRGSKQALEVISSIISSGTDMDSLQGLVTDEAIAEIKRSVAGMDMKQRYEIECQKSDIYFSFPYQIGIMFDESNKEVQRRWVEITMVYHVLKGAKQLAEKGDQIPMNIGMDPAYQEKFSICNYRFIKEFTENQETDWTVNMVNHFKPLDLIEQKE